MLGYLVLIAEWDICRKDKGAESVTLLVAL